MNEQYIHKLSYQEKVSGDVYHQDTGKWSVGAAGGMISVACRAKPNGSGRKKPNKDGVLTEYSFDLGFPYDTQDIPKYTKVKITGVRDELLFEGEIQGFQRGNYSILGWI